MLPVFAPLPAKLYLIACYKLRRNSSVERPACLMMARSVPLGTVLEKWMGIVNARRSASRNIVR